MALKTADGTTLDVTATPETEAAFNAAMAAPEPGGPAQMPAPPKVDPDAPHGRRADGSPKKGPGGRPPKNPPASEVPRVMAAGPAGPVRDYSAELSEIAQGVYLLMAFAPPTQAQAFIWKSHAPGMVHAWNLAARQNATVRQGVEWLTGSGATWVMSVGMATAPLVLQSIALWRDPKGDAALQLQAATVADLQAMQAAQEQAMAAAAAAAA